MSRILVTGGAGFMGSHVVETLLEANHEVMIIDNLSTGKKINLAGKSLHQSRFRGQDILNLRWLNDSFYDFNKPDAVIHLAAQPSVQASWKKADVDAKVNILGTINLLGLCQKYNVKRFVFASTSAVYSPNHSGIYGEYHLLNPSTPYGISKLAAELYIKVSGISYAILRLGNVYGPRQVPLGENQLIPRYLAHVFQGKKFVINGDGRQRRDFIYVKDVANAFLKAVESEETGVFNISSGLSFPVNNILDMLDGRLKEVGHKFVHPRRHGPAKKGELRNVTLDNVLAKHVFNWKPEVDIVEGLRETVVAWPNKVRLVLKNPSIAGRLP